MLKRLVFSVKILLCSDVGLTKLTILMPSFYAVRRGKVPGVYTTWSECQDQIIKFSGASFKKFATLDLAQQFVNGDKNPTEGTSSQNCDSYDWTGSCKQTLLEVVTTLNQTISKLNKYIATLPDSIRANRDVVAGLNETKGDVIMCKTTASGLLELLDGEQGTSGTSKRPADDEVCSSKRLKRSVPDEPAGDIPVVYTDGACFNNGRRDAKAGIGVWWGANDDRNVSERLGGRQTNNRAEIYAACKAVQQAIDLGYDKLEIRTDSKFMIDCMTMWISGWKKRNWTLSGGGPVKNTEELQTLDKLCCKIEIIWTHVKAHCGIEGNECADSLANAGARKNLGTNA